MPEFAPTMALLAFVFLFLWMRSNGEIKRLKELIKNLSPKAVIVAIKKSLLVDEQAVDDVDPDEVLYAIQIISSGLFFAGERKPTSRHYEATLAETEEGAKEMAEQFGYVIIKPNTAV